MLIALDVGNTNTVIGIFDGEVLKADWRIRTERDVTVDELGMLFRNLFDSRGLDFSKANNLIISCVVPPMLDTLENFGRKYVQTDPLVVGPGIKTGIPILIDNPKEVGADRVVNAVAAYDKYRRSLIIIDLGTSTNFDYVSPKGEYMGGVIAPGLIISSEALFQKASKLQRIEISRPKRVIGKDTISAMLSGLVYGHVGLIDGIVRRMIAEAGTDPLVIASGGLAPLVAVESETITEVIPDLTLDGLRILFNLNRTPRGQS
ncbi:MAG: type III pantothenate kinase [Deltaproteobacteria bacterium]|nr:type III pantothenate kinase [Deltaproteobacteria bacterium]MBW2052325.1 type III pantothenate kinase [Deltaproteobacteria bacterium]MBW2140222.1 type III pantothenate kinase [Deltaproteobacteria bacterium]MBW2323472.1 type III pantothenate kinase [Deltaproteobacteria bacterium]